MSTRYEAKWPDEKGVINFTDIEHETWKTLFDRQLKTIEKRACDEFITGIDALGLKSNTIPQIPEINDRLQKTGWSMVAVSGTVDVKAFFTMLSNRQFPVANFIRIPEELDYLKQPDLFHEFFGHGPLLMNQTYADFVQWYGEIAQTLSPRQQRIFSRLFWYTIEFGLIKTKDGLRIMGGGILSSHAETQFALESTQPDRLTYDLKTILSTPYDYQNIQTCYFILPGWDALYALQSRSDLLDLVRHCSGDQDSFVTC